MLKLTHRFWNYTNLACNLHYNRIHLKEYNQFTLRSRCEILNCIQDSFIISSPWGRFLSSAKDKEYNMEDKMKIVENNSEGINNNRSEMEERYTEVAGSHNKNFETIEICDDSSDGEQIQKFQCWEMCSTSKPISSFRVMSYNVLSQQLLESHSYLYMNCPKSSLEWKERFVKIMNEILQNDIDIVCLQEIEEDHWSYFLLKLEASGYKGFYKKKIERIDGCAIFYRKRKFELLDKFNVEFRQPHVHVLNRDNVACMAKFRLRDQPNSSPIVVVTTHLLYNPRRMDVRLAQTRLLLAEIDRFAYYDIGNTRGHFPIILTGDFNSTPDSPVVRLIRDRYLSDQIVDDEVSNWRNIEITNNCQHYSIFARRKPGTRVDDFRETQVFNSAVRKSISNEDNLEDVPVVNELFSGTTLTHPFTLLSAYEHVKSNGNDEVTTFQNRWVTVDYIFYSQGNLRVDSRLCLPSVVDVKKLEYLPDENIGSDHFPLAATFSLLG